MCATKLFDFALENSTKESTKFKFKVLKSFALSKEAGTPVATEYWSEMLVELDGMKEEKMWGDPLALVIRAVLESEIGNTEEAIEALESALEANWVDYKTMSLHPIFEKMRDTPEFLIILEEMQAKSDSLRKAVDFATTDNGT